MSVSSNNLSLEIRTNLVYYLAQLQEKNQGSVKYLIVPLKPGLLVELKTAQIEAIFDARRGIQIKINNSKEAQYVISLLNEPSNLTTIFYKTLQQWYDLFDANDCEPILSDHFEYIPDPTLATAYKSTYPQLKPDMGLSLHMPGLEEDILKTPLVIFSEIETYLESLSQITFDHCDSYPLRNDKNLSVDLGFRNCAENVLKEFPPHDTFYIVNTGHSIPVGALLLSSYHLPCTVFMRQIGLSSISLHRVMSQITSFGSEIASSAPITACNSFVWLLDCHCGEVAAHDGRNGRGIVNFTAKTYLNRMPPLSQLSQNSIKRVVIMVEYCPQMKIELEDLKSTPYSSLTLYLENLAKEGFEIAIRGIDCRQDITKVKNP